MGYTLEYWREGRWYIGRLVEFENVASQGRTLRELEANVVDAMHMLRLTKGLRRRRAYVKVLPHAVTGGPG